MTFCIKKDAVFRHRQVNTLNLLTLKYRCLSGDTIKVLKITHNMCMIQKYHLILSFIQGLMLG